MDSTFRRIPHSAGNCDQITTIAEEQTAWNQRRTDIHEEGSVKIGARRARDFPDIHSASSAAAERHESVCGCSHSRRRRRDAPCRTPGYNLSPALDLDVEPHISCNCSSSPLPPAAGFAVAVRRSPREAVRPLATHATRNQGTGAPLLLASRSWGWPGQPWIFLPGRPSFQHRPHGTYEIMTGGHDRDFLSLWIALLHAIEERTDRRRTPPCLPGGFSDRRTTGHPSRVMCPSRFFSPD
jgi:hypothetical protein